MRCGRGLSRTCLAIEVTVARPAGIIACFWKPSFGACARDCHFDGVRIVAAGRREQEPRADLSRSLAGTWAVVTGQAVGVNHVACTQCQGQLGFDIEVEHFAVHYPVHPPKGRPNGRDAERRSGSGCANVRTVHDRTHAAHVGPIRSLGDVGPDRSRVDEGRFVRIPGHQGLTVL